jgi:hypothetical protein
MVDSFSPDGAGDDPAGCAGLLDADGGFGDAALGEGGVDAGAPAHEPAITQATIAAMGIDMTPVGRITKSLSSCAHASAPHARVRDCRVLAAALTTPCEATFLSP